MWTAGADDKRFGCWPLAAKKLVRIVHKSRTADFLQAQVYGIRRVITQYKHKRALRFPIASPYP